MKRVFMVVGMVFTVLLLVIVGRTVLNRPASVGVVERFVLAERFPDAPAHLAGAIRFRTVSWQDTSRLDSTAFRDLHAYLESEYPRVFTELRVETISDLSLLLTWTGSSPELPPVLIMAHLDVVPARDDSSWSVPPFGGIVAEGLVWGRGALDDKIGVVAVLEAIESLIAEGFTPRRTMFVAFGHDEELGGSRGAAVIADTLAARATEGLAIVLDEGGFVGNGLLEGLEVPVALVGTAEKGYLSLEFSATGAGGHSSAPPSMTAVGRVSRAVTRIIDNPFPTRIDGVTKAMFDRVGPHVTWARRLVFSNVWLFEPLLKSMLTKDPGAAALVRTTSAATIIEGGVKENVLPTTSRAVVNFRILPGETTDSVTERVVDQVADPQVRIRPISVFFNPSPVSGADSEPFRLLGKTILETTHLETLVVAPFLVPGATDARYFTDLTDHVYRFLPIVVSRDDLETIHGSGERIRAQNVQSCAAFVYRFVRNLETLAGS